jgi:hypothetical protein
VAFKLLEKGTFTFQDPLPEGQVSICRNGVGRFCREALESVGIEGEAIVLTDEMTLRIAIRKPRPNEARNAYSVNTPRIGRNKKDTSKGTVSLARALKDLRLDPEKTVGRYPLTTKEDLLIINLADVREDDSDDEETA